jgi:hypothetical protein
MLGYSSVHKPVLTYSISNSSLTNHPTNNTTICDTKCHKTTHSQVIWQSAVWKHCNINHAQLSINLLTGHDVFVRSHIALFNSVV